MRVRVRESKTKAGEQEIFVSDWVATDLEERIEEHELSAREKLFKIPPRTIQREHRHPCEEIGIHYYTIHGHRHTVAVALAEVGTPMPRIRDHLGSENVERTMKYAEYHPEYGDVRPYFEKLDRGLGYSAPMLAKNGNGQQPEAVLRTILEADEGLTESADVKRAQMNRIVAKLAKVVGADGEISGDSLGDPPSKGNGSKPRNSLCP